MTSRPDDVSPSLSSPVFDLSQPEPPALQPPPDLKRIWLGIFLILVLLSVRTLFVGDRDKMQARGERLEKVASALRITKYAYATQTTRELPAGPPSTASGIGLRSEPGREAIEQWRLLTASSIGRVADWRRLGMTQFTFGKRKEGLTTLRKIATLPPSLREGEPKTEREKKRARPEDRVPWADLSPAEEVAFWETVYSPEPITEAEIPRLRAILIKLELNWFAYLALEQMYTKAGKKEEADRERAAALTTSQGVVGWTVWQFLLTIVGIFGLAIAGAHAWHVFSRKQRGHSSETSVLLPPVPPPTHFSYRARMLAFLAYFAVPLLTLPVTSLLSARAEKLPLEALARLSVGFYLLVTATSIAISLWLLRRVTQAENPESPRRSLRESLAFLGFRTRSIAAESMVGLLGHAMLMPLLLIVGFLSSLLFSRFKTPPHPVLFQFLAVSSPLDQGLLLLQTAIVAAVTEELMFRGVFYPALRARYGPAKAIALSAAVFALAHPTLPGGFLPLWLLGASFAFVYERRGSLFPGIVMHALNNGTLLLTQFATFSK